MRVIDRRRGRRNSNPNTYIYFTTKVDNKTWNKDIKYNELDDYKARQRCVMGVGCRCLYAQLVQTKNKQCKSAFILQCYHPHLSDFCSRPRLTQPYNHIIYPGVAKIYLVFFWKCLLNLLILLFLASCSIHLQSWCKRKFS